MARTISKVEVSGLFWKDLADWRGHKDYRAIRRQVSEMVMRMSRGEPAGDAPFKGEMWSGVRHMHVPAKLIVFMTFPSDDTLRLCAIKKHDFYGFRNEKKSVAGNAAVKIANASASPSVRSPGWGGLRWSDPSEIPGHPELEELSREALDALYASVMAEMDTFDMLGARVADAHPTEARLVSDRWLDDLVAAQEAVESAILAVASARSDRVPVSRFERWVEAAP